VINRRGPDLLKGYPMSEIEKKIANPAGKH
jgi:hypothetical protein